MIQLEFQPIVAVLPPVPPKRAKRPRKLLVFVRELMQRKFRQGMTDIDLMLLTALAHCERPPRFYEVLTMVPGISQTGTWNSLERLEGNGMITVGGPPLAHTYQIAEEGIRMLAWLAGKR